MSWLKNRSLRYQTWWWVRTHVLDHTELGYTQKSRDRIWLVVTFDEWSEGEYAELRGSLLYAAADHSSYELWERELCFPTRWAAEAYAGERNVIAGEDIWMPVNLGDLDRFETAWLDRGEVLRKGKFRGSDRVLNKRADHWLTYLNKEHA